MRACVCVPSKRVLALFVRERLFLHSSLSRAGKIRVFASKVQRNQETSTQRRCCIADLDSNETKTKWLCSTCRERPRGVCVWVCVRERESARVNECESVVQGGGGGG